MVFGLETESNTPPKDHDDQQEDCCNTFAFNVCNYGFLCYLSN